MQEHSDTPDALSMHVRAAGRPDAETARLTRQLVSLCWPGGLSDRNEPMARGWLRMWGPSTIVVDVPRCGCARGRCRICN